MGLVNDVIDATAYETEKEFGYAGKKYTIASFASVYGITVEQAKSAIDVLCSQGKVRWEEEESIADKDVRNALIQAGIFETAQAIQEDHEHAKNYKRSQARAGRHVYEKVGFDFGSMSAAKDFQACVRDNRLESEIIINQEGDGYIVRVFELSDKELSALTNLYKANRVIATTVEGTTRLFDGAVKATDYTATKVLVPVTKIGLSGTLGVAKTLVGTLVKIGGMTVSETVKTSRDTVAQIKEDESIAIARAELNQTKNEVLSAFNKNRGHGGTGITIG